MSDFYQGLQRPSSRKYLAFVYRATMVNDIPHDVINPKQVLAWAEDATDPREGAEEQGDFIQHTFPSKAFDTMRHRNISELTRFALRCPYEVWPTLEGCCLACGKSDAPSICTACRRVRYCDAQCQRRFAVTVLRPSDNR